MNRKNIFFSMILLILLAGVVSYFYLYDKKEVDHYRYWN